MRSQLTVDFNRVIDGDFIRANARRAVPDTVLDFGSTITVGDDDWGAVPAEVAEYNADSGSLILQILGELVDERVEQVFRATRARAGFPRTG